MFWGGGERNLRSDTKKQYYWCAPIICWDWGAFLLKKKGSKSKVNLDRDLTKRPKSEKTELLISKKCTRTRQEFYHNHIKSPLREKTTQNQLVHQPTMT